MNKKMREIKAQIEAKHEEATSLFNAKNIEGAEAAINEIENLEKEYTLAEKLFKNEKEEVKTEMVEEVKNKCSVKDFANNIRKVANSMSVGSNPDGGYTVPEDILTTIEELRQAEFSLQDLVDVETVSTMSGARTFKKRSQQTGFAEVGEGGKIGKKDTPQFERLDYKIKKYAGILPVTNELMADSDANIYNVLTTWLAGESRATRNKLILEAIGTQPQVALEGLDGIKGALNVTLGQAFKSTSRIVTNDDGLQYLDTLKDNNGQYLLQAVPNNPMRMTLAVGATRIPLEVIPNNVMPTDGDRIPFIVGDLKEGIKFFDRKKLNIMTSNVAVAGDLNAFDEDLTLFRGIEREDVKVRDAEAFVNGYIEVTASA